jgi:cobyrinic acid a,c-diamide synthase
MVKALIIAGTHSSVGKTTLTVGLCAALRARGLAVQPFKVGPDYIDPGHHTLAAGRPSRNLDTWMMPPERTRALFEHVAQGADVALIEGVMGLFDGFGYDDETGSTAQVAKLLQAPVVLVIDGSKMARSAAALARGFQEFDPDLPLAGFIVNRVGSDSHGRGIAGAITGATGLPVLGWVPRDDNLHVAERHLGLSPADEPGPWQEFIESARAAVATYIDVDAVLALAREKALPARERSGPSMAEDSRVVIAVARDEAFHFCYEENLSLLEDAGATLRFFSPIRDARLPVGTAGVLLSGGFPELYAEALSANAGMHQALRRVHVEGCPIYAECGGLMVLTEAIVDFAGRRFPMAGLLAGHSVMTRRLTLGYRQARAATASWLLPKNDAVRGHEFHYSTWEERPDDIPPAYMLLPPSGQGEPRAEGACLGNLWASYVHLHFWGKPELARRFVAACRA